MQCHLIEEISIQLGLERRRLGSGWLRGSGGFDGLDDASDRDIRYGSSVIWRPRHVPARGDVGLVDQIVSFEVGPEWVGVDLEHQDGVETASENYGGIGEGVSGFSEFFERCPAFCEIWLDLELDPGGARVGCDIDLLTAGILPIVILEIVQDF